MKTEYMTSKYDLHIIFTLIKKMHIRYFNPFALNTRSAGNIYMLPAKWIRQAEWICLAERIRQEEWIRIANINFFKHCKENLKIFRTRSL